MVHQRLIRVSQVGNLPILGAFLYPQRAYARAGGRQFAQSTMMSPSGCKRAGEAGDNASDSDFVDIVVYVIMLMFFLLMLFLLLWLMMMMLLLMAVIFFLRGRSNSPCATHHVHRLGGGGLLTYASLNCREPREPR